MELFLWANIAEKESKCIITNAEAILSLQKIDIGQEWPTLDKQNIDKNIQQEYRNRALERSHANAKERATLRQGCYSFTL